jgi:hypothetical protein
MLRKRYLYTCLTFFAIISLVGCKGINVVAEYEPPLIPVVLSIDRHGNIEFSSKNKFEIPTPLGDFSIGVVLEPAEYFEVENVLVIRLDDKEYIYDLHGQDFQIEFESGYYEKIELSKVDGDIILEIKRVTVAADDLEIAHPPKPTPKATDKPEPVATSMPDCDCESIFAGVWQRYRQRLGCPLGDTLVILDAEQVFQNGHMFWREDIRWGYILYEAGPHKNAYEVYGEIGGTWVYPPYTESRLAALQRTYPPLDDSAPKYSCAANPPEGMYQPTRGFGKMWCDMSDPINSIGWALAPEVGFGPGNADPIIQDFELGTVFRDSDGTMNQRVYVFFDDGTFVRTGY